MIIVDYMARAATCLLGAGLLLSLSMVSPLAESVGSLAQAADRDIKAAADENANPNSSADDHRVIRRVRRKDDSLRFYWEGFKLKNEGDCEGAIEHLQPIAAFGRGFEEAQNALGVCLMRLAGLPVPSESLPPPAALSSDSRFTEGREWVRRAADAGSFEAQRTLLSLYAIQLGPDNDPVEAAKWLQLYNVNPKRLSLGAPVEKSGGLTALENRLSPEDLEAGKLRAQRWVPSYWNPKSATAN